MPDPACLVTGSAIDLQFVKMETDGDAITLCYESTAGRVEVNLWIGDYLEPYVLKAAAMKGHSLKCGPVLLLVQPGETWKRKS